MYGPKLPMRCPKHKDVMLDIAPDVPWWRSLFSPYNYCRKCKKVVV